MSIRLRVLGILGSGLSVLVLLASTAALEALAEHSDANASPPTEKKTTVVPASSQSAPETKTKLTPLHPTVKLVVSPGVKPPVQTISLSAGSQFELKTPFTLHRVAIGDPGVATYRVINSRHLLLTGKSVGSTSLMLWSRSGAKESYTLVISKPVVTGNMRSLSALGATVEGLGGDSKVTNRARVNVDSEVQTQVQFVGVDRNQLLQSGIDWSSTWSDSSFTFNTGTISSDVASLSGVVTNSVGGVLKATLQALESNGYAYTLARPTLVTLSGQSGSFLSGGEFPVPVPSSGSNNVSIEYKPYGISLHVTPYALSANRILLHLQLEVSYLDTSNSVQIAGVAVPALTMRRTQTSVVLGNGQSLVISGLVDRRLTNDVNKIPGLGDLPILGAFFRSQNYKRNDSELLMVVTPHLVRPLKAEAQTPPLPGEAYRQHDPSWFNTFFFDNGKAPNSNPSFTGFSR